LDYPLYFSYFRLQWILSFFRKDVERRSLAFNFAPRNSTQAAERHENRTMDMDWEFTSVKRWLFAKVFIEDGTRTKTS